jgi:hypothetical protein
MKEYSMKICMSEQIEVFRRFENNLERRNQNTSESETQSEQTRISDNPPCDQLIGPLDFAQSHIELDKYTY